MSVERALPELSVVICEDPMESCIDAKERAFPKIVKGTVYTYTVLFEPAAEGGYTVTVPMLPGVITEGDTLAEARERATEAIRGYLKVLRKHREPIPREGRVELGRPITERVSYPVPTTWRPPLRRHSSTLPA